MTRHSNTAGLAEWIRERLHTGLILQADHLRFMHTTFGSHDLAAILAQAEGYDIDSLLELICFPDGNTHFGFEAQWGETVFSRSDIGAVADHLAHPPVQLHIQSVRDGIGLGVALPEAVRLAYVQRLNIDWQPDPALMHSLAGIRDRVQRCTIRAELRHAPFQWYSGQVAVMALLLERISTDDGLFAAWLREGIILFAEMGPDQSGPGFLLAKKNTCYQALCKAEDFEQRLSRQPMEILMTQGYRPPHGSAAFWRELMGKIDGLSRLLYDHLPFVAIPESYSIQI